jgi:hypothetical protein
MKPGAFIGALRLIEDAVDVLQNTPSVAWLLYLIGVIPFFGLFLFEATDIYESPFASDRLLWISLLLAFAYLWMHFCQAGFAQRLSSAVGKKLENPSSSWRALSVVAIVQSTKLLGWPVAVALMIPHSLVTMFYQHALCQSGEAAGDLKAVVREARHDAGYRPGEAVWFLLLILILRVLVWVNFLALFLAALLLFHSFTGLENTLTRQPAALFNPTFMATLCVLAYLALDPVVKAACVLRAFQRRSEKSGLDLQIRLSKLQSVVALVSITVISLIAPPSRTYGRTIPPPVNSKALRRIDDKRIRQAVGEVFRNPNLSWSLPVVAKRKPPTNAFLAFTESVGTKIGGLWGSLVKAWGRMVSRVRKLLYPDEPDSNVNDRDAKTNAKEVWGLVTVFSAMLAAAVLFAFLRGRRLAKVVMVEARQAPVPPLDLSRDDLQADEQPEDEWMRLALEYRRSGNLRLAIRALYLSCLSSLAAAKLISIAGGKSNLDYFREFQRRARRLPPELPERLSQNVGLFEQSWYGSHNVTEEILDQFEKNLEFLKTRTAGGIS